MAIRRYAERTPTTGLASYPTSAITPRRFAALFYDKQDKTAYFQITDEVITVANYPDGLLRLDFVPKGAASDEDSGGVPVLQIWTGPSKTGTQLTPIKADESFGAASARQFRYYLDDDAIDFSTDQTTDGGFTTLYATYRGAYSKTNPEWRGKIEQEIEAAQDAIDALGGGVSAGADSFQATAGEALVEGVVYIAADDSAVYQHDTPANLAQATAVGWITTSYSLGETVTVYIRGKVSKPSAITALPIGKDIYAGASGMPTWDQDTSNPLTSGSYKAYLGKSYDKTNLWLNCNNEVTAVQA